ncbi:DUF177 domain-containing protein [Flavobacterium sp. ASW18X]|uniref:YceD family protein n=1 Tax=Flavobacterium sp. ASW18X TaxID=2572595 RepID=UPI0010ADD572|nr:DUF177 domain-containing protein [Flavobacterium sp. ASW18X]TKD65183.1 DUF177 domain-containing protein [Flavobacterium sp. ASW18X]
MKQTKAFYIPFAGLKLGKHTFEYNVDNKFFESFGYQEFNDADIAITAELNKMNTMMEFQFDAKGTVNVNCDVTNEPFNQQIDATMHLVVKFGEEFNDEDDEILILPHGEHQVNIAQYLYEMLVLAVPQKRVHPGVEDGTLDSPMLDKLEELQPKIEENTIKKEDNTDPRWDGLKKLLTDK